MSMMNGIDLKELQVSTLSTFILLLKSRNNLILTCTFLKVIKLQC